MFASTGGLRTGLFVAAGILPCLAFAFCPDVRADSTRFGVDAEYSHDTNVNRTAADSEEQPDGALSVEGYAAKSFRLSYRSGIVVRGGLRVKEFFEFEDLGSIGFSGRVSYRYQPSPGYANPWIELAASAEGFRHRDSAIRDGHILSASAGIGRHFTDRIRIAAGAGIDRRDAYTGNVYTLSDWKAWGTLDYRLTPAAIVYGAATWIDGEQVFTAFSTAAPWVHRYATASAADPVFASAFGGVSPTAYRVDAQTRLLELGMNIALRGNQALDFGAGYFDSVADRGGARYGGATFRIGYLHRFR